MAKPSKGMPRGTNNKPSGKVVNGIAKGKPSNSGMKKGC